MSDPKTWNPIPLWYEVTAVFSDDHEDIVEDWISEGSAVRAKKDLEALPEEGDEYTVTVTIVPKYTTRAGYK